ncbi:hypothetical protein J7348_13375 [Qipengyuania flava]|uniref:hypothetical protein n=1 Tax=Qipengyuania flava TaxID=192812 RepID=UPI001ADC09F2|nr:hypothetical protein [Qipengyuania flava]MBO9505614.1 hypothetical protein [Qipengyuania flava]
MSSWDASLLTFVDSCSVGDFGTAAQAVLAMAEILDAAPTHYAPLISPRADADRIAELLAADAPLCAAMELVGPLCGVLLSRSAGGTASGMVKIIDEVDEGNFFAEDPAIALLGAYGTALVAVIARMDGNGRLTP